VSLFRDAIPTGGTVPEIPRAGRGTAPPGAIRSCAEQKTDGTHTKILPFTATNLLEKFDDPAKR